MSVSYQQALFYEKCSKEKWNKFTTEEKIKRTKKDTIEVAEKYFNMLNAADKHQLTLG